MPSDEFKAVRRGQCAHLKEIGWESYYGTTSSGNLSQFKATSNPCGVDVGALNTKLVDALDIRDSDFRFYHIKCPYSTESDVNVILDRNPGMPGNPNPTFGEYVDVSSNTASHTVTSGIMIKFSRGSRYGWLCVDDACPHYQDNKATRGFVGGRYFYI
jgi:hypothetical protein